MNRAPLKDIILVFLSNERKALSLLNDEERAVLIATKLEGRTFQELAGEYGEPMGTLLARKSRAIKKIQESFSK